MIERRGPVLHPSPLSDDSDVLGLNITHGCAHRCPFCSVRAAPHYPGDEVVQLFRGTAERLEKELTHRGRLPRAVYISPGTDPFPPLAKVQAATAAVVEVLAKQGIQAWLMTRGFIRPAAIRVLADHAEQAKVIVGLTTLDRSRQRLLEPLTAPPRLRLRQIRQLRGLGVGVQVALEPLIPGLTDTRENLIPLLAALANAGVRHVSTGYLFLRSKIRENLRSALEPHGLAEIVLDAFEGGLVLVAGAIAAARYLPKTRRQRGYASLMALAAGFGITVSISATTNPDFQTPRQIVQPPMPAPSLFSRFTTVFPS
jgi:DNA repair photolyase